MPKGMTPKNRMKKTTISLARSLKPSGILNADDIKRAREARPIFFKLKNSDKKMIKPSGRINMDDLFNADKYKIKKPKRAPMQTKGPMQARPLPMTPELIKKAKDRMVPNPRAQQRDRSKPIIGKPMRRSSARKK